MRSLAVIPKAGHCPHDENPDTFNIIVKKLSQIKIEKLSNNLTIKFDHYPLNIYSTAGLENHILAMLIGIHFATVRKNRTQPKIFSQENGNRALFSRRQIMLLEIANGVEYILRSQ